MVDGEFGDWFSMKSNYYMCYLFVVKSLSNAFIIQGEITLFQNSEPKLVKSKKIKKTAFGFLIVFSKCYLIQFFIFLQIK